VTENLQGTSIALYAGCREPILETEMPSEPQVPCICGSTGRIYDEDLTLSITTGFGIKTKKRIAGKTGKSSLGYKIESSIFPRRDGKGLVRKEWLLDRENDWYLERVVDISTGTVLSEQEHRLSEHAGYGTDKFNRIR
jgi:hypothetical protein